MAQKFKDAFGRYVIMDGHCWVNPKTMKTYKHCTQDCGECCSSDGNCGELAFEVEHSCITICSECGKILTNAKGKRVADAYFDSGLVYAKKLPVLPDDGTTYAWCKKCYTIAKVNALNEKLKTIKNKDEFIGFMWDLRCAYQPHPVFLYTKKNDYYVFDFDYKENYLHYTIGKNKGYIFVGKSKRQYKNLYKELKVMIK